MMLIKAKIFRLVPVMALILPISGAWAFDYSGLWRLSDRVIKVDGPRLPNNRGSAGFFLRKRGGMNMFVFATFLGTRAVVVPNTQIQCKGNLCVLIDTETNFKMGRFRYFADQNLIYLYSTIRLRTNPTANQHKKAVEIVEGPSGGGVFERDNEDPIGESYEALIDEALHRQLK